MRTCPFGSLSLHQRPNGGDRSFPFTHTYLFSSLYPFVSSLDSSHTRRERNGVSCLFLLSLSSSQLLYLAYLFLRLMARCWDEMKGTETVRYSLEKRMNGWPHPQSLFHLSFSPPISLNSFPEIGERSGNVPIIKACEFLHLRDVNGFHVAHPS